MKKLKYKCYVDKDKIQKAVANHKSYDSWGEVEYGDNKRAVEYNICFDNSTDKTEYLSAFYRIFKGKDGKWYLDSCQEWYSYEIDFSDNDWKGKLKEAAMKAYKALWRK